MFGGVGKSAGWATILVAGGLVVASSISARAADLGGDCCADLEERIAELEATTVRKGNKKVSLKISGWVNEAVFAWDDGLEQNVYVGTNSLEQSRFKFAGEAKIDKEWSAGYVLEVGLNGGVSNQFDQFDAQGTTATMLTVRKSYWFLKSKRLGQLSVGQNGTATYHLLDDADATNTRNYSDAEAAAVAINNFIIVSNGVLNAGNLRWSNVLKGFNNRTPGQSGRREVVRYDSPVWEGFSVSWAWGADDLWDAALIFEKEIHDFKIAARAGYGNSTDPTAGGTGSGCVSGNQAVVQLIGFECEWAGGAATVMHKPTGLYLYGGYGWQSLDYGLTPVPGVDRGSTTWFLQPGIERKWHPIGKTTIFGEYRHDEPGSNVNAAGAIATVQKADIDFWAGGVVQNIEAAAMDLYVIYRHSEGDFTTPAGVVVPIDDFDMVISGARIQF
jgi:predicted porin